MVPSVVKIKKGNVEFTSKVDIAKYTINELNRRALLDVGNYVMSNVRTRLKKHFPFTRSHKAAQRYQYWVLKKEGILLLGMENLKWGAKTAWWADQLELDEFVYTPPKKPRKRDEFKIEMRYMREHLDKKSYRAWLKENNLKDSRTRSRSKLPGTPNNPRRHILETFIKTHTDKISEIIVQYLQYLNQEDLAVSIAEAAESWEVLRGDEN